MLPKVIFAYNDFGYKLSMGNRAKNTCVARVFRKNGLKFVQTGLGIPATDIAFFLSLARLWEPKNIFIVGNAFGYSTFILADIFPNAQVDVIDAQIEGDGNKEGSDLTNKIANKYFKNVKLTIGFSPRDLPKAVGKSKYDLVFIDGLHTNPQVIKDFFGIEPYLSDECVVYFHDVRTHKLWDAMKVIHQKYPAFKFSQINYTDVGSQVAIRKLPELQRWANYLGPFENHME